MAKNKPSGFAKIAAEGKIKAYTRVEGGGIKVAFKDVLFADGHRALVDGLMDDETKVRLTIEAVDPTFDETATATDG